MNVTRSTFVQRGCVLTALAVAVLLAGFSGTAWAQVTTTTGSPLSVALTMRASSSTLEEGADDMASTPGRVTVTISWSGTYDADTTLPGAPEDVFDSTDTGHVNLTATCNGEDFSGTPAESACSFDVAVKEGAEGSPSFATLGDAGAVLEFDATPDTTDDDKVVKTIELYISDTSDDGDWDEETIGLTLELQDKTVTVVTGRDDADNDGVDAEDAETTNQTRKLTATPRTLRLTIADDERMPTLKLVPPSIQLAKGNIQDVTALVGLDTGGRIDLPTTDTGIRATLADLVNTGDDVLLSVSPPDAVGTLIEFVDDMGMTKTLAAATDGRYNIGRIGAGTGLSADVDGAVGETYVEATEGIKLRIKAIDVAGFRDEQIMLTLEEGRTEASKMAEGGSIDPSDPATVTILSGEATPTVTFSTESINIDEGDSETVHLLADTDQGDQVGSATVSVSGEARLSLEQGGGPIPGGVVQFGDSANAELTIRARGDESLEDGEEKTATVTITDASGANIGEQRTLTVTVVGSTAVPVLPLVGQLILALLLTVGGARLYRRRQQ